MNLTLDPTESKVFIRFAYSAHTISVLHRVPGARYSPKETTAEESVWVAPKDVPTVSTLMMNFPMAAVDPRLDAWMQAFRAKAGENTEQKAGRSYDPKIDRFSFITTPYLHQKIGLDLVLKNKQFALCAEMGTGKTKILIDLISEYSRYRKSKGERVRCLIVAPLSVVPNWANEAKVHGDELKVSLVVGSRYQRTEALKVPADIFVINYSGVRILMDELLKFNWDVMACDESQNIKHRTSQQSKACYAVGAKAQRRYILTGTMVTNKPLDVFGQFKFLNEDVLGKSYTAFQSRYAVMVQHGRASFPVAFRNLDELAKRLEPWTYRVLKSECLDLPPKIYTVRYADMSAEQTAMYKELKRELSIVLESGERVTAPIVLTKLLRFSQITAGFVNTDQGEAVEVGGRAKIRVLSEVIDEAAGKLIVWCKFKKEMAMIKDTLTKDGVPFVSLCGDDSMEARAEAIDKYKEDPSVKVFVGQIDAGGTGINLTSASTVVYMTNSYSLGTRLQSEDRAHRIGQKSAVTYVDIVCPGTIDEKVLTMLRDKKDIADLINMDTPDKNFLDSIV